jgi:hypothetical protein
VQTAEIASHVRMDSVLMSNSRSDARVENKRIEAQLSQLSGEAELERKLEQDMYARERAAKLAVQEEALVRQMRTRKEEKLAKEKMVQRVRDTSEELKDLEARLKLAYLNKERMQQMEEKRALTGESRQMQLALDAAMEDERQRQLELDGAKENARRELAFRAREVIQQQLREREDAKAKAFEQYLEEKKAVDAVVNQILKEDEIAVREHLSRQKQSREYIQRYLADRERWQREEKQRQADEDRRIQQYVEEQRRRSEETVQRKAEKEDARAEAVARIMEKIQQDERDKLELEALRDELYWEEEEAKRRAAEREQVDLRIRQRLELMAAEDLSKKLKEQKRQQLAQEEAFFRQEMLRKFEEDARLDQLSAQKARLKREQHKREVEALLEERRRQHQAAVDAERDAQGREKEEEAERRRIIEEERMKLLRSHAVGLFGFLPKGVILSEKDLEVFPEEIRQSVIEKMREREAPNREPGF